MNDLTPRALSLYLVIFLLRGEEPRRQQRSHSLELILIHK